MDTLRAKKISQMAYIDRTLKNQRHAPGVADLRRLAKESTGLGAEIVRHILLLLGIAALVSIAVGATTESTVYWRLLNWVSSFFV